MAAKTGYKKADANSSFYEKASPEEQAKQPVKPSGKPKTDGMSKDEWAVLKNHLEQRLAMLRTWRNTWWIQNYSDLAKFILPRRSIWLTQSAGGLPSPNSMTRGLEINEAILDPTATFATRICAGGLMSGLASPSRPWFKIIPAMRGATIDDEARVWLDTVEEVIYTVLARSNFYNAFAQECEDIVIYGTAVNIIYEDDKDLIRCYTPCVGEYYLASGATMRVDGLYRAFVMTVAQIVDFFGLDNCPPDIQKLWKEKGGAITTERLIAHSIEPNFAVGNGVGKVKGDFTWREVYWVYGAGTPYPLAIRGFLDTPFTAARWSTQSNDAYGRSPGMDILPDVMQLQVETARKAEGIEKGIRPPLIGSSELMNKPSTQLPGHLTLLNGDVGPGKGIRSIYETQFDLDHISQDIALIQQRIKVGLFNDLFLMLIEGPTTEKTKFEVQARLTEKLQVIGPVIENILSESLQPKLKRIFSIIKRRGMIPPMPKSMQNVPLDIQFVSILALAQKSASTGGIEALMRMVGELGQVHPEVLDVPDFDETLQEYNDLLGNKQKILKGPKVVAAIRQQRAKQQQQQQQAEALAQTADAANKGAGAANTLSTTDVGQGQSALAAILGTGGNSPRL